MKHMKFLSFFLGVTFSIVACSSNNEIIPVPDVDPDGDDGTTEVEFAKGADIGWVTETIALKGVSVLQTEIYFLLFHSLT